MDLITQDNIKKWLKTRKKLATDEFTYSELTHYDSFNIEEPTDDLGKLEFKIEYSLFNGSRFLSDIYNNKGNAEVKQFLEYVCGLYNKENSDLLRVESYFNNI